MGVFDHAEFDNHESLHHFYDDATGLRTIISVHSTALGPAAGGCRRWTYTNDADALTDADLALDNLDDLFDGISADEADHSGSDGDDEEESVAI